MPSDSQQSNNVPETSEDTKPKADASEGSVPTDVEKAERAAKSPVEAIRDDLEKALRTLGPPTVPWRARVRFNTDGSIDMEIGVSDSVRGLCPVCEPCCCDPWH